MAQHDSSNILHVHDRAFKSAMSDLRVARDFLTHYLPVNVREKIDLKTLQLQKESYVDKELKLLVTDVLYSVELNDQSKQLPVYIYVLLEHLSTPQRLAPWRMVKYTCQIIEQKLKETQSDTLPLVIPLVVYNGSSPYSQPTSIYALFADDEQALAKYYLFNHFQLIDFSQIPDEEIRTHHWSVVMELLLKHAYSRDAMHCLESLSNVFLSLANEQQADSYILSMLKYYIETAEIHDKKRFVEFLQQSLPKPLEQQAMTLAQQWQEEGFQKGIQQGVIQERQEIAKKLLHQLGGDMDLVVQVTGLSREAIRQLQTTSDAQG